MKSKGCGLALAVVRDLREHRAPASGEELADFETDVLAGFVLARASAGLADSTVRNDTNHLELIRDWFGRPLWEMQPADADAYFGKVLRGARPSTRTGRAAALTVYFQFLPVNCTSSGSSIGRTTRSAERVRRGRAHTPCADGGAGICPGVGSGAGGAGDAVAVLRREQRRRGTQGSECLSAGLDARRCQPANLPQLCVRSPAVAPAAVVRWHRVGEGDRGRGRSDGGLAAGRPEPAAGTQAARLGSGGIGEPQDGEAVAASGVRPGDDQSRSDRRARLLLLPRSFPGWPVVNPVPVSAQRRQVLAHRSPLEPVPVVRRARLRQRVPQQAPRSIPDALWDELLAAMGSDRDRALLEFYVSSGARASELLGVTLEEPPPSNGSAPTGSSRKPSPAAPTPCTSPPCSGSTTPPPSATPQSHASSWKPP